MRSDTDNKQQQTYCCPTSTTQKWKRAANNRLDIDRVSWWATWCKVEQKIVPFLTTTDVLIARLLCSSWFVKPTQITLSALLAYKI